MKNERFEIGVLSIFEEAVIILLFSPNFTYAHEKFVTGEAAEHVKQAAGEASSAVGDKLEEAKNVAGYAL